MSVRFHFLNTGDGDCTIVDFPKRINEKTNKKKDDRVMMIDVHHHDDHDEYEHIIDYYKKNFQELDGTLRPIFRFVLSHPHKDHLKGIKALFEEIPVMNLWDLDHDFAPSKSGPDWPDYKEDWEHYEDLRKNGSGLTVLRYRDHNEPLPFWDEDRIEILAPSADLHEFVHKKEDGTKRTTEDIGCQLNNLSYVLLIRVNGLKILLPGDAELKAWDYIMENHKDKIKDIDILKAPHHGRESAFHEEAVKHMNPKHIVFSSSEECEHAVPEKYQKAAPNAEIYKTSDYGSFVLDCDFEGNVTFE